MCAKNNKIVLANSMQTIKQISAIGKTSVRLQKGYIHKDVRLQLRTFPPICPFLSHTVYIHNMYKL